jgi:hypothetical protein
MGARSAIRSGDIVAYGCGVSPAYMSDILNGRREPGESVLRALGFRKVVRYERIPETED